MHAPAGWAAREAQEDAMGTRRIQYRTLCALASCAALFGCDDGPKPHGKAPLGRGLEVQSQGPQFPGAGTGRAGDSIAAGVDTVSCDGKGPPPGGTTGPVPGARATELCLYGSDPNVPAATVEWVLETASDSEVVHVRLTFNPNFVDNTYGANAIGWDERAATTPAGMPGMPGMGGMPKPPKGPGGKGHSFMDLVGSDHAEFKLFDNHDALRLQFKLDYISQSAAAASGYACLGVSGGEGKMIAGSAADVVAASTSLDRNLNACMFGGYTEDSPATDADYTPNASAPSWDFRVVYDVWVKRAAFGDVGFGRALVEFVHASPSKLGENTVDVVPDECPPDWPYCQDPDGCPEPCPADGCTPRDEDDADAGLLGPVL